jgi:HEXXH motif-containing protein
MTTTEGPRPAFLTLPEANDRTYRGLLRKVRLQALRHLLELASSGPLQVLAAPLSACARTNSRGLLAVLGLHDILTPILCHRAGLCTLDVLLDGAIPTLVSTLGRSGLLTETVAWIRPIPRLLDPTRGIALHHPDGPLDGVVAHPDGVEVRFQQAFHRLGSPTDTFVVTRVQHRIAPGIDLSLIDTNPLAMVEAHPDKEGNALTLSDRSVEEWVAGFQAATDALASHLPEWAGALPGAPMRLVPVGFEPERHLSASYREALGVAYVTLHPSTLTLAEAIVHEGQHTRLNALMLLDAVLLNGTTTWTPSPVRPDLRPLNGVLLAAHAFVPVAVFHARLAATNHPLSADPAFAMRRAAVLVGNHRGLTTCQSLAEPTQAGTTLLAALDRVHRWCCDHHPGGLEGARSLCSDALPEGVPLEAPA